MRKGMSFSRRLPPVRPSAGKDAKADAATRTADGGTKPLGKLLLQAGAITREQLEKALETQRQSFLPLGRILRDTCKLDDEALAAALRQQAQTTRIYLRFVPIPAETLGLLDAAFCRENEVVPFERLGKLLCVALSNADQPGLIMQIEQQTNLEVKAFQAPWDDIRKKLEQA
ncbi:MAG: hypothetical protein L6R28_18585 [Planctomycetes bacterium]|nr:hypothetical protein [Planctomycetota bacterium]